MLSWLQQFGIALALIVLGVSLSSSIQAQRDSERRIAFYSIHTQETLSVVYKRNGAYQPDALKRINWILRDWRQQEPTTIDPKLIDLAWEIHTELGSRMPIHVISAFRSSKTNAMLRRTRGGQARRSQHMFGRAMDIRFPDVPVKRLRYSALIRERGGVGYYPTSATPFVHIDTGRVRHWPRMGRYELALLFPNGRTKHRPRRGGAITRTDVTVARRRFAKTAAQVAAFHNARRQRRPQTLVARADIPSRSSKIGPFETQITGISPPKPRLARKPPQLQARPRLVERSSRFKSGPSQTDRESLTRLASLASSQSSWSTEMSLTQPQVPAPNSQAANGGGLADRSNKSIVWVQPPEFDEEHPEELSYRPFPILPYLTATASPHDPALAQLVHPDPARTLELLDDDGSIPPLRMRPGLQLASMLWAQAFSGKAVDLSALRELRATPFGSKPSELGRRKVRVTK